VEDHGDRPTLAPRSVEWILDVGERDFEREVLDRSRATPVLVDFWAPWCQPCRVLGPLLERLADEQRGAFVLARVDVDQNPGLAQGFGVRGIPALRGFRDGALVVELEGAQPEPVLRRLLDALLPSDADRAAERGARDAAAGRLAEAESAFRAAIALERRHAAARLGLGQLLAARGEVDAALESLEVVGPGTPQSGEAERLAAALRTGQAGEGDPEALRRRIAAEPGDLDARLALGRLLAAAGRHEAALEELLEVVRRSPGHAEGAARLAMLDLFSMLGAGDPLTQRFRAALGRALFR
jgi:putative thioredoxin